MEVLPVQGGRSVGVIKGRGRDQRRRLTVPRAVVSERRGQNFYLQLPTIDALLAATAKAQAMTLVSRNVADTADLGASVLNPFDLRMR